MQTVRVCPQCLKALPAEAPQGLCPECLLRAGLATQATTSPGSTSAWTPPTPGELAPHFPQIEILELLGAGGMGMVYKARQPQLDRHIALKILSPHIATRDAAFAERFLREARALARLNHPNIIAVYDFGQAGPYYYFLMEFVDGANLRQLLASQQITQREALNIVPMICDALQFAHDEGVMHRDIKPENILLDRRGRVKIADFGLAKLIGVDAAGSGSTGLTQSGVVMGTPRYMAPEQIEQPQTVDHRADIYSLGVVFYEMLTGELPLGRFEPPSHKGGVDVRLDDVVLRSLEKKPDRRYQKASEVKTDVESIAGSAPPAGTLPPPMVASAATPPLRPRFSRKAIMGAVWAPFAVVAFATMFTVTVVRTGPEVHRGSLTWLSLMSIVVIGVPGLTAPIGTTLLGLLAIHDIRHSRGAIRGLPLALADALLFPLIVLAGVLYWLCNLANNVARDLAPNLQLFQSGHAVLPAALVLTLLAGSLVVFLSWRAARQPAL